MAEQIHILFAWISTLVNFEKERVAASTNSKEVSVVDPTRTTHI